MPVQGLLSLSRLMDALSRATTLPDVYDAALDALQESLGVERAAILLFDEEGVMRFVAWRNLSDDYRRAVSGHTPWRPETRKPDPIVVPDVDADPSLASYIPVFRAESIRALGFFPLPYRDGVLGKFMLYYAEPHTFTDDEIELARTIAGQIAFGIARIRAEEGQEEERSRLSLLSRASKILASSLDYETTLAQIATMLVAEIADWCVIDVLDGEGMRRLLVAHRDPAKIDAVQVVRAHTIDRQRMGVVARVIESMTPELVPQIDMARVHELYFDKPELIRAFVELGLASAVVVPLVAAGRPFGALSLFSGERRFDQDHLALALDLGIRAGYAVDHARLFREAQEANRAKDEFLATLSHELRTPMTATLGWATMLRMGALAQENFQLAVETIERSTRAQARLIDEILDVSRIVTGKLQLNIGPVNLRGVIEAAIEAIRPSIDAKRIELRLELPEVSGVPTGDAARLQQVIWNLLSNSVKFTPAGGTIAVTLEQPSRDRAQITVRDSGAGISPKLLPFVFERFRQGDSSSSRAHGGLGLGLAIVRSIVELHGGSVTAMSEGEGRGTTMTIALPLLAATTHADATATHEASAPLSLHGLSVLLVEDEDDTRMMVSTALQNFGARVTAVGSVRAAIDALQEWRPDVVVSDIGMPGEDGYHLIVSIRSGAIERVRDVPAIALTAYARPEDRDRAFRSGFEYHLAKPLDPLTIVKTVREAAGRF